jgi:predicted RNase H-like nuclease (RuvC/YqgF family)
MAQVSQTTTKLARAVDSLSSASNRGDEASKALAVEEFLRIGQEIEGLHAKISEQEKVIEELQTDLSALSKPTGGI